ncbi:SET domain-containing protein 4 isoform X1 [Lepisosteus oculatus]|uniref:SET domain-containing protein 4 isoform X1 n=2 Tax=Lepisosteus oculatus TaxID=7918 RepID=UPI0035F504DA
MRKRFGRAGRKRRRKHFGDPAQGVNLSGESQYVELRRWLKLRGFSSTCLIPAHFSDTGRGLMTSETIEAGDLIISLPEKCLLSTSTVLRSHMGELIKRWKPPVSPLLALCTFLISERHSGTRSLWKPYIDVLPKTYTCPVYFSEDTVNLLPAALRKKALKQRETVQELYESAVSFFKSLQPLFSQSVENIFTQDALCWAWCSVNTRTVYMKHPQSDFLSMEPDVYALAPYLDLLNHCPDVQVEAAFSEQSRCYEIRSGSGCRRREQAFICYGPHDNQRLLLEYGFVARGNPHSAVYVEREDLQLCLTRRDQQITQKLMFLKDHDFSENLTFGLDGPSWRLLMALRLLSLQPDEFSSWKRVLLGAPVSHSCEQHSFHLAAVLCQHLIDENTKALEKIHVMKGRASASLRHQLDLVESLRNEEQRIMHCSLDMLKRDETMTFVEDSLCSVSGGSQISSRPC